MNFEALKNFMDRLTSWRIPGNSISVCLDGKEVFNYQSGYENYEKKIPMTKGKLFNVFSCSKPVTVVAALQLYEKGFFLLDDPLYDFIPEYKKRALEIYENDEAEYAPNYALQTNMLGMNGDEQEYRFRLWSSIDGGEQALTICLEKID